MTEYIQGLFIDEIMMKYDKIPDFPIITFENGEGFADEVVTYADLFQNACKLAHALKGAGIGRGDRFSVVMKNHPELLYALGAASQIGAVMVPIDPRSKGNKLTYQMKDSNSKGIIFTNEFTSEVEASLAELPDIKVLGVSYKEGFEQPHRSNYPSLNEILAGPEIGFFNDRSKDLKAPLEIIYTSGTTGDPKGVVIRADRMPMFKMVAQLIWQYNSDDKLYTGLSLTHGNAQSSTLGPSIMLGIPAVFSRKFTKSRLWDICRKHGCTTFSLVGGMMMGIYSEPRRSDDGDNPVRKVLSAGTPRSIWEDFENRFNVRIHEWYGAVEGGFAHKPPDVGPVGSFGKPIEGVMEIRIVNADDSECGPYEIGELTVISKLGKAEVEYVGNRKASEEKTRGGVLRSGDMCHKDKDGWLYFDYRKGGGLRRQGDFIMPEYVEKALADLPEVIDVCVYGIAAESGSPGESDIVAAIVPAPGVTPDPKKIALNLAAVLEKASIPQFMQVVPEIPKTVSEKNLDRILRTEFRKDSPNVTRL
ncbi:MAG: ATP-dependent acyl-CoA ligase [Desulfobacteraceae bacterium]|nr:MAG: ATP-dependent acyl-CoA ligase [Desulfobacteraceae bacterium]